MSAESVREFLQSVDLSTLDVSVCLASLPKGAEVPTLASLSMTSDLQKKFVNLAESALNKLRQADAVVMDYEPGYKPDPHEIEWMDHKGIESVTKSLACVPSSDLNVELFDGDPEFIDSLHFYVIVLRPNKGERLMFFRKYNAQHELSRSRKFLALFRKDVYDTIQSTAFSFDDEIDCVAYDGSMVIFHKYNFQLIFRFFEKVREAAVESLKIIAEKIPMADFKAFEESCLGHLQKQIKLKNITNRPYFSSVTMQDLKRTIKKFKLTTVWVATRNGKEILEFDHSDRWVVLKLLDDAFLGSAMTKLNYLVNSKRQV